jgi:DNA-directed RNA polymerase subunit RPC12/RpoP
LETYGIHKTLEIDYGNNEGRLDISLEVLIWLCCDITDNWKELVKKYKKKSSHQIDLHCPDCGCKFIRDKNPDFEKYCRLLYDINDPEEVPIYKCSNCGYNVFINNNIYDSKLKNFPHLKS